VWVELAGPGGLASRLGLSVGVGRCGMRIVGGGSGCAVGISVANTGGMRAPGCGGSSAGGFGLAGEDGRG
jgi:hypothetical protein